MKSMGKRKGNLIERFICITPEQQKEIEARSIALPKLIRRLLDKELFNK